MAGKRGVDVQTIFVNKQEAFQDALTEVFVGQINTLRSQLNTFVSETNIAITQINIDATTSTTQAGIATTKANEANTSAYRGLFGPARPPCAVYEIRAILVSFASQERGDAIVQSQ
jgi:hypothetical protein